MLSLTGIVQHDIQRGMVFLNLLCKGFCLVERRQICCIGLNVAFIAPSL